MRTTEELNKLLQEEGIVTLEKDLREMTREELLGLFASKRSGRLVLSRLIKNSIWQTYQNIQEKKEPPIKGNIRTYWYRLLKPVLSKIPDEDDFKTDLYDLMLLAFTQLIQDKKLLRYADFDFTDENFEHRRIGSKFPEVLVYAEKRGWIRVLRQIHKTFGVSVLALGGAPSALTSEYGERHQSRSKENDTRKGPCAAAGWNRGL